MTITPGADVAFIVATMWLRCAVSDGKPEDLDFRLTVGLRKIYGQCGRSHTNIIRFRRWTTIPISSESALHPARRKKRYFVVFRLATSGSEFKMNAHVLYAT